MAKTPQSGGSGTPGESSYDAMLMRAMEQGDDSLQTGRQVVTYNTEGAGEAKSALESLGLRIADARDYSDQQVSIEDVGDADAVVLPEIGVAIVNAADAADRANAFVEDAANPIEAVEPEYFVFGDDVSTDFLRGFRKAAEAIANGPGGVGEMELADDELEAEVLGATWGLAATRVPQSSRNGAGVRVAVLDTGMALNHPDFAGRPIVGGSFVGQPVMDLHGHGTHCIGTACGPASPPGLTPRYGIGHRVAPIFAGKVLSNSGSGGTGSVLAGMNWAIANGCAVISMSLGSQSPPQFAYTVAGRIALLRGCLIIAAAGNAHAQTGAPANSPTIMAVASLDRNLVPSNFSNFGKIEIAAPGRDVFSAAPMPRRYAIMSGTSMATPHVAGCAALWAQTSPALRGQALWNRLVGTARPLPFPPARVGRGLVQAPA